MIRVKLYIFLMNGSVCRQMGFSIKVNTKLTGEGAGGNVQIVHS